MKKLLLITMIVVAFLFNTETKAQVRVNLNVNIGARPNWGVPGNYAGDYYYLPEIDSYYDIPRRQFIYFDGGGWIYASSLPYQYRDYDLYNGYKVVINEPRPYLNCQVYRERYSRYYNNYRRPEVIVQSYPDNPYNNNRNDNNRYNNNPYNNERFSRARENQHFDNKQREDDHEGRYDRDERGRGNDRGRDNDHGRGRGRD